MQISQTEALQESVDRSGLVVSIGRGELRSSNKASEKREQKQSRGEDKGANGRMNRNSSVIRRGRSGSRPDRCLQKSVAALVWLGRIHKELLGHARGSGSVFQALKLFAGFEANRFARGDADLFARAGIAANAGLARLDAEDAELAKFDALTAAESAFQRLENSFDSLFRFGAADVGFADHRIYDIELNHTALQDSVARC